MKALNPYINFNGRCREALDFYTACFDGEVLELHTFAEMPECGDEVDKDAIMHSAFRAEGIYFMATDGGAGCPYAEGSSISLSINLDDEDEQTKLFNALAEGGNVMMPLEDTFWNARFGMLTDKFGIDWMLNCNKPA